LIVRRYLLDSSTDLLCLEDVCKAFTKKKEGWNQEQQPKKTAHRRLGCAKNNSNHEEAISDKYCADTVAN